MHVCIWTEILINDIIGGESTESYILPDHLEGKWMYDELNMLTTVFIRYCRFKIWKTRSTTNCTSSRQGNRCKIYTFHMN
jgi:hypothetical protein